MVIFWDPVPHKHWFYLCLEPGAVSQWSEQEVAFPAQTDGFPHGYPVCKSNSCSSLNTEREKIQMKPRA